MLGRERTLQEMFTCFCCQLRSRSPAVIVPYHLEIFCAGEGRDDSRSRADIIVDGCLEPWYPNMCAWEVSIVRGWLVCLHTFTVDVLLHTSQPCILNGSVTTLNYCRSVYIAGISSGGSSIPLNSEFDATTTAAPSSSRPPMARPPGAAPPAPPNPRPLFCKLRWMRANCSRGSILYTHRALAGVIDYASDWMANLFAVTTRVMD